MHQSPESYDVWPAVLDSSGRVLLPAELRKQLNATRGANFLWVKTPQGVTLKTFEQSLSEIQSYYQNLSPASDVWSEELLARRKLEAQGE